jgi:carbon-monoxide dehydrogenase catalytic subunit
MHQKRNSQRSVDPATIKVLEKADREGLSTIWTRHERMEPRCGFGELGICCNLCLMGPCRIDPFSEEDQAGCCGATVDAIVARNLARAVAGGAAAHADHGRGLALTLLAAASGEAADFMIGDREKLRRLAGELGVSAEGEDLEIANRVAEGLLSQFGQQEGDLLLARRAPEGQQTNWRNAGLFPRGIDRDIVEILHRTHEGVDADYRNILRGAIRTSLADGWGGSMVATEISDILFCSPWPIRAQVNLGVLKEDEVNVVVHGHEPSLAEMMVRASREPELLEKARSVGAGGVNLAGMCCSANEILMRKGFPVAGNFLQQELAIATGAVEMMAVDVQCVVPGIAQIADCYHTKLVTTSPKARIPGVQHIPFEETRALDIARELLSLAVENFAHRDPSRVEIPTEKMDLVAGFTAENIFHHLGGRFRSTYRPLNDGIAAGRIRGVVGVVGCSTPKKVHDESHLTLVKHLLSKDVLVVQTGCAAIACGKAGLMKPEAAWEFAGEGLREICEAVGIPPVLHMGSCVDNSRILMACTEMVREGGIGEEISQLPVAAVAPEAMSEKAVTIAFYAAASGIFTVFAPPPRVHGSRKVLEFLCEEMEDLVGGRFAFEDDATEAANRVIAHLDEKRGALKLKPMMYQ